MLRTTTVKLSTSPVCDPDPEPESLPDALEAAVMVAAGVVETVTGEAEVRVARVYEA